MARGMRALRVDRLLAVDRGGLEADETRQGEHQRDAERAGGDLGRAEGLDREGVGPDLEDDQEIEDEQDPELQDHQGAEHLRRQVDVAIAE